MKKNTFLGIIIKYYLFIVSFYTVFDLIRGEIKLSEIPSHILNLVLRLFVLTLIASILFFIVVKIFRVK